MGAALAVSVLAAALAVATSRAQTPPRPEAPKPADGAKPATAPGDRRASLPELPPRVAVAGTKLLETTSTLTFVDAPGVAHTLVATFAFPGRARLHLARKDAPTAMRELRYRYGPTAFALGAKDAASRELAGEERLEVLRDVELRRATFLYPDGDAWQGAGASRTATLGELGSLRATIAADGDRPSDVELLDAQGKVRIALRRIAWTSEPGRKWPASLEGWRGETLAWTEKVDARDTAKSFVDSYFLPPDLRDPANEVDRMLGHVRAEELPRFVARRVELAKGLDWEKARAELERLQKEWTERLKPDGLSLDPNWTVELGADLAPCAMLVRLAKEPADPSKLPDGFVATPARSGRVVFLARLGDVAQDRITELREALPKDARAQSAYVRIPARPGPVLLVLPIEPGR